MARHLVLAVVFASGCSSPEALRDPVGPVPPQPAIAAPPIAPWTLTASDGSGLALVRVDAKAVVDGPLAFTELHLYFKNPEDRVREGRFAITLPPHASVSRFAMAIDSNNGQLQEAEMVDKAYGRRVYEDFLHRRQDPALLEKSGGNEFTARVFPIAARSTKHIVVSFGQELTGEYVLPLRGLPVVEQIDVRLDTARVDGSRTVRELHERSWLPDRDFTTGTVGPVAVGADGLVALQYAQPTSAEAADVPRTVTLLVDTSASRALGFARYVESIRALAIAMRERHGDFNIQLVAFDQTTQTLYDGSVAALVAGDGRAWTALASRGAEGASDLGQAAVALALGRTSDRLVIVTDGVITAGPEAAQLASMLAKRIGRVDVVLAGGIRDDGLATTLSRAGRRPGDVFDLDRGTSGVAIGLGERVVTDVAIKVANATWTYPRVTQALRAGGDPITVYAKFAAQPKHVTIDVGGDRRTLAVVASRPALVGRAVASAEIAELERGDLTNAKLREEIARRSVAARVISSQTALLVLETEYDYQRYRIERNAVADILTVGPDGLEQSKSTRVALGNGTQPATTPADPATPRAEPLIVGTAPAPSAATDSGLLGNEVGELKGGFGYGRSGFGPGGGGTGWGTIGTGRYGVIGQGSGIGSGYGVGSGRGGMRGRSSDIPTVSLGVPVAVGDLDKAIIRRYIKRNIQKIQYCYERELLAQPQLAGAVRVEFTINANGTAKATAAGVSKEVSNCVAGVVSSIEFPRPQGGGVVQVLYPLIFVRSSADLAAIAKTRPSTQFEPPVIAPLTGKLADVMAAIERDDRDGALALAKQWRTESPGDLLAIIALGEALEARGRVAEAGRVYGSIIDLHPARADLRRFAGERLERVAASDATARRIAIDSYRRAVADRPDHITGHRLLAFAHVRAGDLAAAFTTIVTAYDRARQSRSAGADRVLADDVGMIARAYHAAGGPRDVIARGLGSRSIVMAQQASTRFVLYWETDTNDVDFHIRDARGGHAWYGSRGLASGGELYNDVTTGYGPECFALPGTPAAGPYELSLHYYAQGPMGFGMGLLQIQRFDGTRFTFDDRPYVIMNNNAYVALGKVR